MRFEDVADRFQKVKKISNGYMCVCPCHDDKKASLGVSQGKNGNTLLKCLAGCNTLDILGVVGLKMSDLFADSCEKQRLPKGEYFLSCRFPSGWIEYKYHDFISGQYLFSKIRDRASKNFLVGSWDDDSKERFSLGCEHSKNAVYGAINHAKREINAGAQVFVFEGEKDVFNALRWELPALTFGSATADISDEVARLFEGASVVICRDNDKPGEEASRRWADSLKPYAKDIKIINLCPELEHGDFTDFVSSGGTKSEFMRIASGKEWEKYPVNAGKDCLYSFFVTDKRCICSCDNVYLLVENGKQGKKYELDENGKQLAECLALAGTLGEQVADLFIEIIQNAHRVEVPKQIWI